MHRDLTSPIIGRVSSLFLSLKCCIVRLRCVGLYPSLCFNSSKLHPECIVCMLYTVTHMIVDPPKKKKKRKKRQTEPKYSLCQQKYHFKIKTREVPCQDLAPCQPVTGNIVSLFLSNTMTHMITSTDTWGTVGRFITF